MKKLQNSTIVIKQRSNPKTDTHGLQLSSPDDGCCPGLEASACMYKFQWATLPTSFGNLIVTINGVNVTVDLAHTYVNTQNLYEALYQAFVKSTLNGGFGMVVEPGDIRVYLDKYIGAAGNTDLTVEIISAHPIVSIATNQGTLASATPQCDQINMCEYRTTHVNAENFKLAINNTIVTDTTYATGVLLRSGLDTAIGTANLAEEVQFLVNVPASGTTSYVKIFAKEGLLVTVNDVVLTRIRCGAKYLNQ